MADAKDLNFECKEVREAVYDLMRFWVEKGCDGYRVCFLAVRFAS
jgi:alpha-glucosidase